MAVGESTRIDGQVCWLVNQPRKTGWCVGHLVNPDTGR